MAGPGPRPYRKNGALFNCVICGEEFYRKRSLIERGITKTCGKTECKSQFFSGDGNPAWGRIPTQEHRDAVRDSNLSRPKKKTGPPPGWTHSKEAREAISKAMRERWKNNRDEMIKKLTKPKTREMMRYRREFTPYQKRAWKESECKWCGTDKQLELDHIIPIVAGGVNIKENAQTLCRKCNLWKMVYIDRPYQIAQFATEAASE